MILIRNYRKVVGGTVAVPISCEKLRFDLVSSDYALDALSRLILRMFGDGRGVKDIAEVTLLPRSVIEEAVLWLKTHGLLSISDDSTLPKMALDILERYERLAELNRKFSQTWFDLSTGEEISMPDSVKISAAPADNAIAEFLIDRDNLIAPPKLELPDGVEYVRDDDSGGRGYIERRIDFLPSLGGTIDDDVVEVDSGAKVIAEIPARAYEIDFGGGNTRKIFVELLGGSVPNIDDDALEVEAAAIRFKADSAFDEYYCDRKIFSLVGERDDISVTGGNVGYIRVEIFMKGLVIGDAVERPLRVGT